MCVGGGYSPLCDCKHALYPNKVSSARLISPTKTCHESPAGRGSRDHRVGAMVCVRVCVCVCVCLCACAGVHVCVRTCSGGGEQRNRAVTREPGQWMSRDCPLEALRSLSLSHRSPTTAASFRRIYHAPWRWLWFPVSQRSGCDRSPTPQSVGVHGPYRSAS